MGENSKIEWCDNTFNPWIGCQKVSAGCANCYAERDFDKRRHFAKWGPAGTRSLTSDAIWRSPIKWNRDCQLEKEYNDQAEKNTGERPNRERRRVFCASLADVFEDWQGGILDSHGCSLWIREDQIEPETGAFTEYGLKINGFVPYRMADVRARLWALIDQTPHLDWLLLTKRPENARLVPEDWWTDWPRHVWLGTSVEDQAAADKRIPELLKIPAAVHFLSCEPLLGAVDLKSIITYANGSSSKERNVLTGREWQDYGGDGGGIAVGLPKIDWVIAGGESGPAARPSHPGWFRALRDQCQGAGVPFFFKQFGEWIGMPDYSFFKHGKIESYESRMIFPNGVDAASIPREERREYGQSLARCRKALCASARRPPAVCSMAASGANSRRFPNESDHHLPTLRRADPSRSEARRESHLADRLPRRDLDPRREIPEVLHAGQLWHPHRRDGLRRGCRCRPIARLHSLSATQRTGPASPGGLALAGKPRALRGAVLLDPGGRIPLSDDRPIPRHAGDVRRPRGPGRSGFECSNGSEEESRMSRKPKSLFHGARPALPVRQCQGCEFFIREISGGPACARHKRPTEPTGSCGGWEFRVACRVCGCSENDPCPEHAGGFRQASVRRARGGRHEHTD